MSAFSDKYVNDRLNEIAELTMDLVDARAKCDRLQSAVDEAFVAMNSSEHCCGGPTEREAWHTAWMALCQVATHQRQPEETD